MVQLFYISTYFWTLFYALDTFFYMSEKRRFGRTRVIQYNLVSLSMKDSGEQELHKTIILNYKN